ncbi:MAG: YgaP-like transmembrane domain [Chitinophagaceae bacterium]
MFIRYLTKTTNVTTVIVLLFLANIFALTSLINFCRLEAILGTNTCKIKIWKNYNVVLFLANNH